MKMLDEILEVVTRYGITFKKEPTRIYLGEDQHSLLLSRDVKFLKDRFEVIQVKLKDHLFVTGIEQEVA